MVGTSLGCADSFDQPEPEPSTSDSDRSSDRSQSKTTQRALIPENTSDGNALDKFVREKMSEHGVGDIPNNFNFAADEKFTAGILLFHDRELSGRRDTACADCHPLGNATADVQTLAVGPHAQEGPNGVRVPGPGHDYFPRNTPDVLQWGLENPQTMFWDSRVEEIGGQIQTPQGPKMLPGLDNVIAAQAMMPVVARDEMRGEQGHKTVFGNKNELAAIPDDQPRAIWDAVMDRILAIPTYRYLLSQAYPNTPPSDMTFVHAANAIGKFVRAGTALDSPFDNYVRGDDTALTAKQKKGAALFYGPAGCADCHSGNLQTDQKTYNVAIPQLGPGLEEFAPLDPGRHRVTGDPDDKFKFRTPKLRNVELTGPYMHNGAYADLEGAVRHFDDPMESLKTYDPSQLPSVFQNQVHNSPSVQQKIAKTYDKEADAPIPLTDERVDQLVAFLKSLTSPVVENVFPTIVPDEVPSGVPVGGAE